MALTVTSRGGGSNNTTGTSYTPGARLATLAVGSLGVLCMALDNAGSGGAAVAAPASTTDAKGNVWTRQINALFDNGAASAGIEMVFYTAPITTALLTGDAVTLTWVSGVSVVAKAWTWYEVIPAAGATALYDTGGSIAGATAANASVTTGTIAVGNAVIAGYFSENVAAVTGDTDTTNGSWGTQQTYTVGSTTSGVRIATQQKVQTTTASTQTYDATVVSQDRIAGWIALKEVTLKTGTDSGAATDAKVSAPGVAHLRTEAGAGGEVAVRYGPAWGDWSAIFSNAASAGAVAKTGADAGVGADTASRYGAMWGDWSATFSNAASSGVTDKTGSDSGVGSETGVTTSTVGPDDIGTGSDTSAVAAALATRTDAGAGTDTAARTAALAGADAGAGADTAALAAAHLRTEAGAGADTSTAPVVSVTASDAGAGSDTSTAPVVSVTASDAGAGSDSGTLGSPVAAADAGAGADTAALGAAHLRTDAGAGADTAALGAAHLRTEAGAGADTSTAPVVTVTVTDGGAGADTASVASATPTWGGWSSIYSNSTAPVAKTASDSGVGSEQDLTTSWVGPDDIGTGSDTATVVVALARSDSGVGVDTATLNAGTPVTGVDSAHCVETATVTVSRPVVEAGVGGEAVGLGATLTTRSDTGVMSDAGFSLYVLLTSESGVATESATNGIIPETDDERHARLLLAGVLRAEFFPRGKGYLPRHR